MLLSFGMLFSLAVSADESINILTINVRTSNGKDGENSWDNRKDFLVNIIQKTADGKSSYDFIGCQEAEVDPRPEFNQVDYIVAKMPNYDSIWRSREKTNERGESMLILWRKDRWRIDAEDNGTFWLSDTPEAAGSKTEPNAAHPRCVTFGLFHEIKNGTQTGQKIYVASTHFDHKSEEARQKAAKQIMNWIANRRDQNAPLVIMGDLNCDEKSPVIKYMQGHSVKFGDAELKPPTSLVDTFRAANPDAADVGTFNGFKENAGKKRVDYIFITKDMKTVSSKIIKTKRNGRWATDHCPVEAVIIKLF
ncbi:MAG: endonuclease/exonuclease/phosphatase family protein [Planctomycetaceae bacterium]|nr:endonuclease/exonuclease/phosphatase family protein [Planctomycetaceae bacterium]